jgi:hypothetical protein
VPGKDGEQDVRIEPAGAGPHPAAQEPRRSLTRVDRPAPTAGRPHRPRRGPPPRR